MIVYLPLLLNITAVITLSFALYQGVAALASFPSKREIKALKLLKKRQEIKKDTSILDTLAAKFAHKLPISNYQINSVGEKLEILHYNIDPRIFIAKIIFRSIGIALIAIPCFFVIKIATIFPPLLAILIYFNSIKHLDKEIMEKREIIELELPRFIRSIASDLKWTHDLIDIFEHYKKQAGKTLTQELDVTIIDMKSGNLELALIRLDKRVSIASFSNLVRGLLGVIRGDVGILYFENLAKEQEGILENKLKIKIKKMPGKMKMWLGILFGLALFQYLLVLAIFGLRTLNVAFSM